MFIPLEDIHIPPEEDGRIREPENTKDAVAERAESLLNLGQLQPILVEELDDPEINKPWLLIDGQIRYISMLALSVRYDMDEEDVIEAFAHWGMKPHHIEAKTRDSTDDLTQLMAEFHANEDRDDFTWEEKGRYIRRAHELLKQEHDEERWTAQKTAKALKQSQATVSQYLQLTNKSDPATRSDKVKNARTKRTAYKQLKIEKEKRLRRKRAKTKTKSDSERGTDDEIDFVSAAKMAVYHGDCREWIKEIPDATFSWFHWDPPYGGKEGRGGAFPSHGGAETDHEYCLKLMEDMLPEIWRTLEDGSWLVMWYTPVHHDRVRWMLQGHRFDDDGVCVFCDKHIVRDYVWLSENYSCRPSDFPFWVNPYPNMWFKEDRVADGHEIQRFLTKQTENFFFAGKQDNKTPVLMRSDRGNVFNYPMPSNRRHANQKSVEVLKEIISCISVPASIGGDAGAGSGTIIEAATLTGRRILTTEAAEDHYVECLSVAIREFEQKQITPKKVRAWMKNREHTHE